MSIRQPAIVGLALAAVWATAVVAEDPLHQRIDRLITTAAGGSPAPATSDAGFLRRVSLDLVGQVPTADEVRNFLEHEDPDKRRRLIDRLLADPRHPRRLRELFHVMLMERRGEDPEWQAFLDRSFAANKPWDQLVREIANPDADNEQTRGSAFFITKRLEKYGQNPTDHPGLAADVGRLFLGMDFACAQCHDHLFIDDYKQADFQGLFAFVNQTFIERSKKFPAVGQRGMKAKLEFQSVFVAGQHQTGPRVPGGPEHDVPVFKKGEEYLEVPEGKEPSARKLKFDPLALLARDLPRSDNQAFRRNIANRLWFVMMGRGLVHPLDLHHGENPASHPELLDLLAGEIAARKFDIRSMIRELALTATYQRSGLLPEPGADVPLTSYRVFLEKPLSAEQLLWSMLRVTGQQQQLAAAGETPAKDKDKDKDKNKAKDKDKADDDRDGKPLSFEDYRQRFLSAFANPPREPETEFSPSVRAALFLMNDATVLDWLKPVPGNLVERLSKTSDDGEFAEELYLSVLSRPPTDEERQEVAGQLARSGADRVTAATRMAWALLAGTEFATNH